MGGQPNLEKPIKIQRHFCHKHFKNKLTHTAKQSAIYFIRASCFILQVTIFDFPI